MNRKLYALIDAAVLEKEFFTLLEQEDPPSTCLYSEPLDEELAKVAPYLLQVTPVVKIWLDKKSTVPWGYYLTSRENLVTVRLHLKKYLQVILPEEEKPVFLRFYDPRVIWNFLSILDDWTLHQFMGPIDKITTCYQNEREDTFKTIREQFPKDSKSHRSMLTLTTAQYEILQQQELLVLHQELVSMINNGYQQQQIEKNNLLIHPFYGEPVPEHTQQECETIFNQLADDLIAFCQHHNIDEVSAKTITRLLVEHEIYHMDNMPAAWKARLTHHQESSHYNVNVLTTLLQQGQEVR